MGNIKEITLKIELIISSMIWLILQILNLLKIDKNLYKNIDIYYIGYIKDSDYVKINSVNPLYLIIDETDGHLKKNENKFLILDSTDKNKEQLTKYTKLWDGIKNSVEKVNNELGEYEKDFMKIKFSSDDSLPLNKTLNLQI